MKIPRSKYWALLVGTPAMVLAGCATVNPSADYQRSAQLIERATGIPAIDPYTEDALVAARVETLVADGLTAPEAAEVALLNNLELRAAFREVGMARAALVQSGLLSNPKLSMAFRLPAGGGLAAFDLDIAQNIADVWQLPARQQMAERDLQFAILKIAHLASEIAAAAKAAQIAARGAEKRLSIARQYFASARQTLELTESRQRAGAGNALDVNLARGAALEAELAAHRARLAASDARRELAELLGLSTDAELLALADEATPPTELPSQDQLTDAALTNRLDVESLRQAVSAAEARLALAHRRAFPHLALGLSLEREARGAAVPHDDGSHAALGPSLALELPVFDQNQAQIAKARYQWEQAVFRLRALEAGVIQDVRGAADEVTTARQIAELYETEVLPQAQQNLDLARESYRAGKTGFLSVLDADRTYLHARGQHAAAMEQAAAAHARLERTIGLPFSALAEKSRPSTPVPAQTHQDSTGS